MHELDRELSVGSEEEDEAHGLSEGGARSIGLDLLDDEPLDDGVRGVGHGTITGSAHGLGHGSHGLGSELSVGCEEEGDQHSEGRACGLNDDVCGLSEDMHGDTTRGLGRTCSKVDDGARHLGMDMHAKWMHGLGGVCGHLAEVARGLGHGHGLHGRSCNSQLGERIQWVPMDSSDDDRAL